MWMRFLSNVPAETPCWNKAKSFLKFKSFRIWPHDLTRFVKGQCLLVALQPIGFFRRTMVGIYRPYCIWRPTIILTSCWTWIVRLHRPTLQILYFFMISTDGGMTAKCHAVQPIIKQFCPVCSNAKSFGWSHQSTLFREQRVHTYMIHNSDFG